MEGSHNSVLRFNFELSKGIAMLEYLLKLTGGEYNYMALLKLAFFADRYHLRTYARPVSGDEYFALKLGPVPSRMKDIISELDSYRTHIKHNGRYDVYLQRGQIKKDEFSESDIEAMNFAFEYFGEIGKKDEFRLANITHAYPEWEKYREIFTMNPNGREKMNYLDFLQNADPENPIFKKNHFTDPFTQLNRTEVHLLKEELLERFGTIEEC
jgi:uncharacterized phage-associated protein